MIELLLLALTVGPPGAVRDTTFQVQEGDRLVLESFQGDILVAGGGGREVRAEARGEDELTFRLDRRGSSLTLRVQDRKGRARDQELRVQLPAWMELEVAGREFDAEVRGLDRAVSLHNLDGDLVLYDLSGVVSAYTADGEIRATGLTGESDLSTGDGDVIVRDCSGSMQVNSVDGDVRMSGMRARRLEVRSTAGDLDFSGQLLEGGEYGFHTHSGEVGVRVDPPVNITATVLAYDGEFQSGFPVRAQGYESGKSLEFTVGNGGARLVLEAFDGDIVLIPSG